MGRLKDRELWRRPPAWLQVLLVLAISAGTYLAWHQQGWSRPGLAALGVLVWATGAALVGALADRYGTDDPSAPWWRKRLRGWVFGVVFAGLASVMAPNPVVMLVVLLVVFLVVTELEVAARRGRAAAQAYDERVGAAQER